MEFRVAAAKANFRRMLLMPPLAFATFRSELAREKFKSAAGFPSVNLNKSVPLFLRDFISGAGFSSSGSNLRIVFILIKIEPKI